MIFLSKSENITDNSWLMFCKFDLWFVVDACNNDYKLSRFVSSYTLVYTSLSLDKFSFDIFSSLSFVVTCYIRCLMIVYYSYMKDFIFRIFFKGIYYYDRMFFYRFLVDLHVLLFLLWVDCFLDAVILYPLGFKLLRNKF